MDSKEYVDFLCLACGLQGSRAHDGENSETDDSCPKCGEKLLIVSRPQPKQISV